MRNFPLVLTLGLALAGCATGPRIDATEPVPHERFGQETSAGAEGRLAWWRAFDDPVLSTLIERALAQNLDVRMAGERLAAARAVIDESRAGFLPRGSVAAAAIRQQLSETEAAGGALRLDTRYVTGFDASWELDLFGRVSHKVRWAAGRAQAREETVAAVRLTVAAEVARTYFELAEALERQTLATESLDRQQAVVELIEIRAREGFADPLDEKRARAERSLAVAELSQASTDATLARHRLAVLLGENASHFAVTPQVRETSLVKIAVGTPASLLATRPDLRRARANLGAVSARADAVEAEILPRVTLTGFLGLVAGSASRLNEAGAESWFVSPAISLPVFDLPRIRARIAQAHADEREALLAYQKAVLEAFAEVESSLARYTEGQQRLEALRLRAEQAVQAAGLARLRYEAGAADYLVLLEAERTANAARTDLAGAVAAQRIAAVSVFKAFGIQWLAPGEADALAVATPPAGGAS